MTVISRYIGTQVVPFVVTWLVGTVITIHLALNSIAPVAPGSTIPLCLSLFYLPAVPAYLLLPQHYLPGTLPYPYAPHPLPPPLPAWPHTLPVLPLRVPLLPLPFCPHITPPLYTTVWLSQTEEKKKKHIYRQHGNMGGTGTRCCCLAASKPDLSPTSWWCPLPGGAGPHTATGLIPISPTDSSDDTLLWRGLHFPWVHPSHTPATCLFCWVHGATRLPHPYARHYHTGSRQSCLSSSLAN